MRITILNGNPDPGRTTFDRYLEQLTVTLRQGHEVTVINLREKEIHYCQGCFGCWIKQPGECIVPDDSAHICRQVIHSDLVLFASPMLMGFVSALLKKTNDKLIPLIHPYFVVDQNEAHHRARYDHYPLVGLLLEKTPDADDEDIAITRDIYSRTALNFKSRLAFTKLIQDPVEEVAHAINHV